MVLDNSKYQQIIILPILTTFIYFNDYKFIAPPFLKL